MLLGKFLFFFVGWLGAIMLLETPRGHRVLARVIGLGVLFFCFDSLCASDDGVPFRYATGLRQCSSI